MEYEPTLQDIEAAVKVLLLEAKNNVASFEMFKGKKVENSQRFASEAVYYAHEAKKNFVVSRTTKSDTLAIQAKLNALSMAFSSYFYSELAMMVDGVGENLDNF